MAKIKNLPSTQKYLKISEIQKDCIVLKDGSLRAVLMVSSINFGLKSEEEQNAIVASYVQFLNSLEFPIQIVIHSRKLNIEPYLNTLREREREITNELLKAQIRDYTEFVKELVELGDIMTKRFYVVVPYNPLGDKKRGFFARLSDLLTAGMLVRLRREKFEIYREQLLRRVEKVVSALASMGLKATLLDTQSLIELFYNIYNPVESETQKLEKLENLKIEI
jgi:type IV secretory pathway VirB4 component